MSNFTIACVIVNSYAKYYTGAADEWDDIVHACLYTPRQAEAAVKTLLRGHPKAEVKCVIQDRAFNYFDGKRFAYDLPNAKLFSMPDALAALDRLPK